MRFRVSFAVCALFLSAGLSAAQAQSGPAPIWQGAYLGAQVGGSWGKFSNFADTLEQNNLSAGVYGGYNMQFGSTVLGIEGDIEGRFGKTTERFTGSSSSAAVEFTTPTLGSIRGRLGYAAGPTLFYATGGIAFLQAKVKATAASGSSTFKAETSDTATGFVVGGGLEYKFSQSLSGRIEGLHYGFGDVLADGVDFKTTTVRAGLTYHFN
jgi:outer membrane immunogenic protein